MNLNNKFTSNESWRFNCAICISSGFNVLYEKDIYGELMLICERQSFFDTWEKLNIAASKLKKHSTLGGRKMIFPQQNVNILSCSRCFRNVAPHPVERNFHLHLIQHPKLSGLGSFFRSVLEIKIEKIKWKRKFVEENFCFFLLKSLTLIFNKSEFYNLTNFSEEIFRPTG